MPCNFTFSGVCPCASRYSPNSFTSNSSCVFVWPSQEPKLSTGKAVVTTCQVVQYSEGFLKQQQRWIVIDFTRRDIYA